MNERIKKMNGRWNKKVLGFTPHREKGVSL